MNSELSGKRTSLLPTFSEISAQICVLNKRGYEHALLRICACSSCFFFAPSCVHFVCFRFGVQDSDFAYFVLILDWKKNKESFSFLSLILQECVLFFIFVFLSLICSVSFQLDFQASLPTGCLASSASYACSMRLGYCVCLGFTVPMRVVCVWATVCA